MVQSVCRACGRSLTVRYDLKRLGRDIRRGDLSSRVASLWRYREILPVLDDKNIVSLGEGFTPIVSLRTSGEKLGLTKLRMKDESLSPTGSFKARGLCLAVSKALELGVRELCIPTAGNAGGALAAYASAAGLAAHIFMPDDTPEVNFLECVAYGATVHRVRGSISEAAKQMIEGKGNDWFDMSTLKEPYRLEGKKTLGYEIAEQLNWRLPDVIVYPTGGGTGLIGMWKAFAELEGLGWIGPKRPRLVAVQSSGCAPIVQAYHARASASVFWEGAKTIAAGLRVPRAFADWMILGALYESHGTALSVSDDSIRSAMREASNGDGVLLSPEGAATLAALRPLVESGFLQEDTDVIIMNTGSGLKYVELLRSLL
jgi:threonine synthase